jgi:hypothetical protein
VKVVLAPPYSPDAPFERFRQAFADAVSKRNATALFSLVAPGFVSTVNDVLSTDFDPGRDAQHNFRVLFGFRAPGKDADGQVEAGPFWEALAIFARDDTFYQSAANLVCSPIGASIVDEDGFDQARARVENPDQAADWYFVVRSTAVTAAPGDASATIATLEADAVPVLNAHPPSGGALGPAATHYEVLLPTGSTGWVPAGAVRALQADRLCYALTANGEWKIAIYDSAG